MARFYVPEPEMIDGILRIRGDEVKHIRRVLRLKAGDEISVFDGSAKEYQGTILEENSFSIAVRIEHRFTSKRESSLEITLAQSLLKGERMDFLVRKATELGVKDIVPFSSSRSVPLLESAKELERRRRWEKIAIEAAKQCGRGMLPKIGSLRDYRTALLSAPSESLRFILWEKEGRRLKEILGRARKQNRIFFIVGPEGGFSRQEVEEAMEKAFVPVTLGERILRAETASLCLLSILQYEFGDMG